MCLLLYAPNARRTVSVGRIALDVRGGESKPRSCKRVGDGDAQYRLLAHESDGGGVGSDEPDSVLRDAIVGGVQSCVCHLIGVALAVFIE
eukprot:1875971-Prymnesium_polylepis.2